MGKLQQADYDFRSWGEKRQQELSAAGAVYEYAASGTKLRWPALSSRADEPEAERALGGFLYCLTDLVDDLTDNVSFGELYRTNRDELKKAFGRLHELTRDNPGC